MLGKMCLVDMQFSIVIESYWRLSVYIKDKAYLKAKQQSYFSSNISKVAPETSLLIYANELNEKRLAIMYKGITFTLCKLSWVSWELLVLSLFFDWYYNISNGDTSINYIKPRKYGKGMSGMVCNGIPVRTEELLISYLYVQTH